MRQYINYANRGMVLENDINLTNNYYIEKNIAIIYKKPTPIKITKVNYTLNKIQEAYFESPSTLDYNGIYKGKYIEFDAKETKSKTSFPLSNIHFHQLEHLKKIIEHGGICFLIISFTLLNKVYLLYGTDLIEFINNNDRKSIPLNYFMNNSQEIKYNYLPRLDYLKLIDKYLEGEKCVK